MRRSDWMRRYLAGLVISTAFPLALAADYSYEVISKTGDQGLLSFGDAPSINDAGMVAFIGRLAAGDGVFVNSGAGGRLENLAAGFAGANRTFGRAVQLNNHGVVIARDQVSGAPPTSLIRFWQAHELAPATSVVLARGGGNPNAAFDSVLSHPTLNNAVKVESRGDPGGNNDGICDAGEACIEQAAFSAFTDTTNFLATLGKTPLGLTDKGSFPTTTVSTLPVRPVLSDNGRLIARLTVAGNQQIMLINYSDLTQQIPIATLDMGFTSVGMSPAISDDGRIAAFYGDLTPVGAAALKTTSGPGIFAWIDRICVGAGPNGVLNTGAGGDDVITPIGIRSGPDGVCDSAIVGDDRQLVATGTSGGALIRIAGVAGNRQLDAGETCLDMDLDGVCGAGEPDLGPIGAFDPDVRVSVSNNGSVAFVGTDNLGTKTLFTTLIDFFTSADAAAAAVASPARAVARIGDTIDGWGVVQAIGVHDAINNKDRGQVVFWAQNSGGAQAIVRASPQCPEGSYATPSTNAYIHQYDAGAHLPLPIGLGQPGGNSCGPSSTAMAINAFQFADARPARVTLFTAGEMPITSAYGRTMRHPAQDNRANLFDPGKGRTYLNEIFGPVNSASLFAVARTQIPTVAALHHFIDDHLDRGQQVIVSTSFTSSSIASNKHSGGHVILLVGRTSNGDYIVKDPAGNFFAGSAQANEHYGPGKSCGGNVVYSRAALRERLPRRGQAGALERWTSPAQNGTAATTDIDLAKPRWALAVAGRLPAAPARRAAATAATTPTSVTLRARSNDNTRRPYAVWIVDGQGRRAGFPSDAQPVTEIPDSQADLYSDVPSDPDSDAGDGAEEAALYSVYIPNPPAGLQLKVVGLSDAEYEIDVMESSSAGAVNNVKTGPIKAGQAMTIPLGSVPPPLRGDLDGDGDVDSIDVTAVTAARSTHAAAGDPHDLDGNGRIDALDARIVVTLCTRPRCATN
ncbi:Peptidase_C39 like family protein [Duganella sp. CF517]|uniref:C39 family peptidase n=1 Tax=Duganella sp. CF517 TaxID=1881038 RepID=UPI0008B01D66|nr:C39 family peptidase [Duganella sp. CF517]SEO08290.1 Peptidase_C39 like family protein [Duganella sp. CF517]